MNYTIISPITYSANKGGIKMKMFKKFNHVMATEGYEQVKRNLAKPAPKNNLGKLLLLSMVISEPNRKKSYFPLYDSRFVVRKEVKR